MAKVAFTAGRVSAFTCPADKAQAFLWDATAAGLGLRTTPAGKPAYVFQNVYQGKDLRLTIGNPGAWSIDQARDKARALQRLITAWQESGASDESARQAMAAVCAVMGWVYEAGHLEALPPAVQKALVDLGPELSKRACEMADREEESNVKKLQQAGAAIVTLTAADKASLREMQGSVGATWAEGLDKRGKAGTEILKAFTGAMPK